MTPAQLDEIEKLAEAATPGPWSADAGVDFDDGCPIIEWYACGPPHESREFDDDGLPSLGAAKGLAENDANFIVAMRDAAIPLIEALEEAWKEREDYRNDAIAAENECDRMLTSTALLTYLVEELVQVPRNGNRIEKLVDQSRTHLLRLREYEGSDE